eukprot:13748257-Heterocapsa_arctica.AAC.1
MVTEETVNNIVTMVAANMLTEVVKIREKLGVLETTQDATKQMTEICFKDIEKKFLSEHDYIREKFGH